MRLSDCDEKRSTPRMLLECVLIEILLNPFSNNLFIITEKTPTNSGFTLDNLIKKFFLLLSFFVCVFILSGE